MTTPRPASKRPIPKDARKVYTGKIFDVYQWQQTLFDGSTESFEKIKRADTVNVIPVTREGRLILSEQEQPGAPPFIGVLGGRIERGEDPEDAAQRELREEAGIRSGKMVLWHSEQFIEKIDWAVYTFIAKECEIVVEPSLDPGEKIKLIYVTFHEFVDIVAQENYRDSEIALRLLRIARDPRSLEETRKLFLS
jgi:8-oxo-dGTP pyrophosphatase MutT (NUDIX family)